MDFLTSTRDSYDDLAERYLDVFGADLAASPLDRALYDAFARLVLDNGGNGGGGPVADVGCGPGWLTTLLRGHGLDAFGIDLSPRMIEVARRLNPGARFEVGSMLALDLPDSSLAGLVAAYSLIHVPWERRPDALAEFHRVLAPGGQLLLVFQVGDDRLHLDDVYGTSVDLVWYRQQPDELAALATAAGFEVCAQVTRRRERSESRPQGFLLAERVG